MPTTPPPNHQVKGEGINHIKELDLRSKLPGIQQLGLHIKTANNVKNGTSGVKTKDVTKKLQQTTTTPFENKKKWKACSLTTCSW
jgi:hypothetical protein